MVNQSTYFQQSYAALKFIYGISFKGECLHLIGRVDGCIDAGRAEADEDDADGRADGHVLVFTNVVERKMTFGVVTTVVVVEYRFGQNVVPALSGRIDFPVREIFRLDHFCLLERIPIVEFFVRKLVFRVEVFEDEIWFRKCCCCCCCFCCCRCWWCCWGRLLTGAFHCRHIRERWIRQTNTLNRRWWRRCRRRWWCGVRCYRSCCCCCFLNDGCQNDRANGSLEI